MKWVKVKLWLDLDIQLRHSKSGRAEAFKRVSVPITMEIPVDETTRKQE